MTSAWPSVRRKGLRLHEAVRGMMPGSHVDYGNRPGKCQAMRFPRQAQRTAAVGAGAQDGGDGCTLPPCTGKSKVAPWGNMR